MGVARRLSAGSLKLLLGGVAVVAVVAATSVAVVLGTGSAEPEAAASNELDCSVPSAANAEAAAAMAAECEIDVEVLDERTPWMRSWAAADGTARVEVSSVPAQVEVDGEWVDVDRSLVADEEAETIEVAAPVYGIELNAGDASKDAQRPLGVIERDGERLEVWFPLELPEPTIEGPRASYELEKGVRLEVTVSPDATGFTPVVVLESASAAARFEAALTAARSDSGMPGAGMDVAYRTVVSGGLSVVGDETGAVEVIDAKGETLFEAPPPLMWDSTGRDMDANANSAFAVDALRSSEAGEPRESMMPGPYDRVAPMAVKVDDEAIVVSPDSTMLSDASTVWPVYLDPSFSGKTPVEWTQVRTGGYTSSIYKWTADIDGGSGRCTDSSCGTVFTSRVVWEFGGLDSIKNLVGGDVLSGSLKVYGLHSYSCTAATTDAYLTNAISSSSTWSSVGAGTVVGSRTESQRSSCGTAGWKEFNVTNAMKSLADNNWSTASLGLRARDEGSMAGWKRFTENATLSASYNRAPNKPTSVQLSNPVAACAAGTSRPQIRVTTPTLSAVVSDPDGGNVQASFQIVNQGTSTEVWSSGTLAAKTSGSTFTAAVPSGKLVSGKAYQYRVTATDGSRWSGWSTAVCEFTVDTSKPAAPTVTPVATGYAAVYKAGVERGGKGLAGAFAFGASGATDVVSYKYGFNTNPPTTSVTGASPTVTYTPTAAVPVTLYVQSIDKAGNVSATTSYKFDVAAPKEDAIWTFDDVSQEEMTAADTAGVGTAKPLAFEGEAAWTTGPHELFGARDGDGALELDGAGDYAATSGPVIDTRNSFAISAFVRLNAEAIDIGKPYTSVLQDGVTRAGFQLRYVPSCSQTGGDAGRGCWQFVMSDADSGTGIAAAYSSVPVIGDEWVHLVGEHDAAEKKVRLWVCPVGTPDAPAQGIPVKAESARSAAPWQASGAFAVGRGLYQGGMNEWWPGQIDNVRVFSGEVVAEAKIRRMCQGAEATDSSVGNIAIDPTVGE